MTSLRTRVAVIGGGLMGCWTAFFLRRHGIDAALIERGRVGAQSSGVNFGNIRLQGRDPGQYALSLRSHALWEQLEALIGDHCEFEQTGHLYLAFGPEQDEKLRHIIDEARLHGVEAVLQSPTEIRARWPWLSHEVTSASWSWRDATANPRLVTPAVARAAQAMGARIFHETAVCDVQPSGNRFRVVTDRDLIVECDWLVNAAGAWAPAILAMLGEPQVPLFAAGPPQFVTEPLPRFIHPSVQAVDGTIIFRQVERGNVIAAGYPRGASDPIANRAPVQPEKTLASMRHLVRTVPHLVGAHVIRVWSGIEGYLPDMLPVIGLSATHPQLLHAFGFCGHGFQLGPGVGDVLAEIITQGATPTPLQPFALERFKGPAVARSAKLAAEFDASLIGPTSDGGAQPRA